MPYAVDMTYDGGLDHMLSRWGLGLSGIARVTGLPTSRVRHWRAGGPSAVPPEAVLALDQLNSWLEQTDSLTDDEPASWLDRRLVDGYTVTGYDLYCDGEGAALQRIAAGEPAAAVLDRTVPDWRGRFYSRFEVFQAGDGHLSIRPK